MVRSRSILFVVFSLLFSGDAFSSKPANNTSLSSLVSFGGSVLKADEKMQGEDRQSPIRPQLLTASAPILKQSDTASSPINIHPGLYAAISDSLLFDSKERNENGLSDTRAAHIPQAQGYELRISDSLAKQVMEACPHEVQILLDELQEHGVGYLSNESCMKQFLFAGNSGTGKTTFAKALSKYLRHKYAPDTDGFKCVAYPCGSLVNPYQGSGDLNVGEIFKNAVRFGKPCIIVFDEMQELFKKHEGKKSTDSTLSTLWQALDFHKEHPIIFIGIFNLVDNLPAAIQSRFEDSIVRFALPSASERQQIIAFYIDEKIQNSSKNKLLFDKTKLDVKEIAEKTEGFSKRSLSKLVDHIARVNIKQNESLAMNQFDEAIEYIKTATKKAQNAKSIWTKKALIITGSGVLVAVAGLIYTGWWNKKQAGAQKDQFDKTQDTANKGLEIARETASIGHTVKTEAARTATNYIVMGILKSILKVPGTFFG